MKEYLRKIAYFLSLPLLMMIFMELLIHTFDEQMFTEEKLEKAYYKDKYLFPWIDSVNADSLIVLAGSSSVKYGLSCSILNGLTEKGFKFINISMDASDPIQTYFILKNINTNRFNAVYFGLDPVIYTKRYYKYRNYYLCLDMSPVKILQLTIEHDKNALFKRYLGLLNYFLPESNKYPHIEIKPIPSDFGSVALTKSPINFDKPINELFQISKYGWSDLQFIYLKKISMLCRERKIDFFVFLPPKRSDFSETYKEKCKEIHRDFVNNLYKKDLKVPIFGKIDEFNDKRDYALFADQFHLNKTGQIKYSELFYEMMKNNMNYFSREYKWFLNN